jgi:hypothetical protein
MIYSRRSRHSGIPAFRHSAVVFLASPLLKSETEKVMRKGRNSIFAIVAAFAAYSTASIAAPLEAERDWTERVAPLLDRHCFKCHGGVRQRGGLDLRSLENILKGGESGPAIIPGEPDQSHLYKFLHADSDPHMPPKKQLAEADALVLKQWIAKLPKVEALGLAADDSGWQTNYAAALSKTRSPVYAPPAEMAGSAVIDRFIELGWSERGVQSSALATDRAFARRVYLDLAGRIPPEKNWMHFSRIRAVKPRWMRFWRVTIIRGICARFSMSC